jgi:hypothetical protein
VLRRCVPREEREEILKNATHRNMEDTVDILEHKQRYGQADSLGLRCTRMLKVLLQLARNAKGVEIYHKGMQ